MQTWCHSSATPITAQVCIVSLSFETADLCRVYCVGKRDAALLNYGEAISLFERPFHRSKYEERIAVIKGRIHQLQSAENTV